MTMKNGVKKTIVIARLIISSTINKFLTPPWVGFAQNQTLQTSTYAHQACHKRCMPAHVWLAALQWWKDFSTCGCAQTDLEESHHILCGDGGDDPVNTDHKTCS
jgi:hypothetical protein